MSSDFLFARPSFIGGMAHIFDFGGFLREYNKSPTAEAADARAFFEDWKALRDDLLSAIKQIEKQ